MAQSTAHRRDSTRPATYYDMLAAPAAPRVAEMIDETADTHPRAAPPHAVAACYLGGEFTGPSDGRAATQGDGGSSTSRTCTSARTSCLPRTRRQYAGQLQRSRRRDHRAARCGPPRIRR